MDIARISRGMIAGLLAAAVALGIGQLVAGFVAPDASPVVAVGESSIGLTPPPVKSFAISAFGSHDKVVLVAGILAALAVFAAVVGALAMRRLAYGMAGLAVFTAIGVAAALTRPTASADWALPTLVGGVAAAGALRLLVRAAPAAVPKPAAGPQDIEDSEDGEDKEPDTYAGPPAVPDTRELGPPATTRPGTAPTYRPPRPAPVYAPGRRRFLRTSAAAAGTAVVAGLAGRLLSERSSVSAAQSSLRLPRPVHPAPPLPAGSNLRIPGLSSFITPNSSFYRVDTAIVLPEVPPSGWHLRIHGMVAREITISFDELIRRPLTADYITLTCVSNPVGGPYVGNAEWIGASLASLLREAGIRAGAEQLLCTSVDGFTSGTPVQTVMDGRDALLAMAMNGTALPVEHGFPVRMVVPGLYGYVSACKWITDINVTTWADRAYWAQPGQGWAQQAPIKTESRIDVPSGDSVLKPGRRQVAGVAWAQHKGIDAVEVRVDSGAWHQARLATVPDIDCWRQWVWDWDATPGTHQITARATDATGYTQTATQDPPPPNGASGYPVISVTVSS
jgi:DMSO/TMAO reductase YedYZ molybdopterin-dependent catalytic subunit